MKFSVLMSTYKNDKPEYLKKALESVIEKQSVKPDEVILVIDGPIPEELNEVVKYYQSKHIFFKPIYLDKNGGLGNALKVGLEKCSNEIVARMDSDDISVSNRFEKELNEFEEDSELSIVGGEIYEFINSTDDIVGIRKVNYENSEIYKNLKYRCPFNHMTVMFKKSDVLKSGGYIDWHYNEDYYLWIRMAETKCKFKNINENLVYVRVGKEMYKRRGGWKYFKSEYKLQKYMLNKKIINIWIFFMNTINRFIVQVLLPNNVRQWVFQKFAREKN